MKDFEEVQADLLCEIVPGLIQWRLAVFYAPFYTASSVEILQPSDERPSTNTDTLIRPSAFSKSDTQDDSVNAHRQATTIQIKLAGKLKQIDLVALAETYVSEQSKYKRRCLRFGITSSRHLHAIRLLERVAKRLDIPMHQIEVALAMYREFMMKTQRRTPRASSSSRASLSSASSSSSSLSSSSSTSPPPHAINRGFGTNNAIDSYVSLPRSTRKIYDALGAQFLANGQNWPDLANILFNDIRDVADFSIFSKNDREHQSTCGATELLRNAINACQVRYFKFVEFDTSECEYSWRFGDAESRRDSGRGCDRRSGSSRDGQRPSRNRRRSGSSSSNRSLFGGPGEANGDDDDDNDNDNNAKRATIEVFSRLGRFFCWITYARSSDGSCGVHLAGRFAYSKEHDLVYELSEQEEENASTVATMAGQSSEVRPCSNVSSGSGSESESHGLGGAGGIELKELHSSIRCPSKRVRKQCSNVALKLDTIVEEV